MQIKIEGRFPGMNEIIDAASTSKYAYARMKEEYTTAIAWYASKLPQYGRVDVNITWYEPNSRRDPDNITAAAKFILDGLVMGGVVKDDSQKYVRSISHYIQVDKDNPRVEIDVEEAV